MAREKVYTKEDILEALDQCVRDRVFPVLDNVNNQMAKARLTVFRSSKFWLLVFEIVGYSPPENEFVDHLYLLGNCVSHGGQIKEDIFVTETQVQSIWDREEGKWLADRRNWQVAIRDQVVRFEPTVGEYQKAGIEIDAKKTGPGSLRQDQLIRFLSYKMGDALLATDQELRSHLPEKGVRKFLQFGEWRHPDIRRGEMPSQIPFFVALAEALETGSKKLPPEALAQPNTHWSHWVAR